MKKIISLICVFILALTSLVGCGDNNTGNKTDNGSTDNNDTQQQQQSEQNGPSYTVEEIKAIPEIKPDITEATDYKTELWVAVEIPFTATANVKSINDAEIDVTFKNRETGTTLVMPGFWDGGKKWAVRFAPTEYGVWDYSVKESADGSVKLGLDGTKGTLAANSYKGDLEIYQRGFVTAKKDTRYFVYADGTPFFYLGDTHWAMIQEEYDSAGKYNCGINTDSHFKYIVDKRVSQKFTVYQSEPIGHSYNVQDGNVSSGDISGFQRFDKYFQYIAEKGLVHANAELIFPSEITSVDCKFVQNIRALTRFWVARYAAYPVMWTLGQEVDNDFFGNSNYDALNNPYIKMCEYIYEFDPYKSPISGHQENTLLTGARGVITCYDYGTSDRENAKGSKSVNQGSAFNFVTGHTWYAVQWRPDIDRQYQFEMPKDFWENGLGKVAINYETRYDYLYTKEFGARANGWISFLCGMYGYGYGAADIWCYLSTYSFDQDHSDGVDTVTKEDKQEMKWGKAVLLATGDQLTYMRGFLTSAGWYKLVPEFDYNEYFNATNDKSYYVVAHDGNDTYVGYFYNKTTDVAGNFAKLDGNATYTAQWFDPRTGKYTLISTSIKPEAKDSDFIYQVPEKPVADDMAILLTKN